MNEFRDSEKERFLVSFILEDPNLNLLQKAKGYPKPDRLK